MSDRDQCKYILAQMARAGYTVVSPSSVDLYWSDEDVEYFLANYGDFTPKE
jgi:hypothetical protein